MSEGTFERKPAFGLGPHPAEPRRKWRIPEDEEQCRKGRWIFSDASADQGKVGMATVKTWEGVEEGTRGWRLQDGYPVHMAELLALGKGVRRITEGPGGEANLASDSRVALDMLVGRRGGTADKIERRLREFEEGGGKINLWWVSDSFVGMKAADGAARKIREEPDGQPREHGPVTRRMLSRGTQRAIMERWQATWDREDKGRCTFRFQKKVDLELRGWSHRAVCLLTGHGPFRGYFRRFNLKAGTEECSCGEGPETAEHVMEDCQLEVRRTAREEFRRNQVSMGRPFPFQVSRETGRGEVLNFNRFAAQVVLEEEMEALGGGGGNNEGEEEEAEEEEEEEEEDNEDVA